MAAEPCHSLKMRTFSTFDLYRKHEDAMTPAGLAFSSASGTAPLPGSSISFSVKFPCHQPLRYLDRQQETEEPSYGIY